MKNFARGLVTALMVGFGLTTSLHAQNTALSGSEAADANPDPVFVFNRVCYAQVPDVQAIRKMAFELAWKSMDDEAVKAFKAYQPTESLDGWDVQVGERLFRLGLTRGKAPEGMTKNFAGFENGTATSCSLVLDDQQNAKDFMPNMQRLAGKEPVSRDVREGLLQTTTWAGGNDDIKVFLIAKAPPTGKGGLLNVTVLQK